jgi:nucleoside 2-deoxyribosyltransferase
MKDKVYLSGPLFSQAEIEWGRQIKSAILEEFGDKIEIVWPHEIAMGPPKEIFQSNHRALNDCKFMVAILDGAQVDDGTAWEIGYHFAKGKKILGIRTDFRKAGEAANSKVNAMLEFSCVEVVNSLDLLILNLKEILKG